VSSTILRGGSVLDGTGGPARSADIVIRDGRIAEIREQASGGSVEDRVIDVDGLTLAPGFIDAHSHADYSLPSYPDAINSLSQGVTTEVLGNCGYSLAPVATDSALRSLQLAASHGLGPDLAWDWTTFAEFADRLDAARPAVDCALLVGHGQLRIGAMGSDDRQASPAELEAMRAGVREALAAGAWGMSTGLVYPPGSFASTDELIAVGEPLRGGAGIYASHIRSEGYGLAEALREAVAI